jgi:hypothetical protein
MSLLGALLQLVANVRFPMGGAIIKKIQIVAKLMIMHALFFLSFYSL